MKLIPTQMWRGVCVPCNSYNRPATQPTLILEKGVVSESDLKLGEVATHV